MPGNYAFRALILCILRTFRMWRGEFSHLERGGYLSHPVCGSVWARFGFTLIKEIREGQGILLLRTACTTCLKKHRLRRRGSCCAPATVRCAQPSLIPRHCPWDGALLMPIIWTRRLRPEEAQLQPSHKAGKPEHHTGGPVGAFLLLCSVLWPTLDGR